MLVVLIALISGVGVGVGIWALIDRGSEPSGLPTPEPDDARATLSYLEGEGAALARMHTTASGEPFQGGPGRCRETVRKLEKRAPSPRVAELLTGVADEPLRAALDEERRALGLSLSRCLKSREVGASDRRRLTRAAELSNRRLDELRGAAR